jgi:hypothetical protein
MQVVEMTRKREIMAYFEMLSKSCLWGHNENYEILKNSRTPAQIQIACTYHSPAGFGYSVNCRRE